MRLTDVLAHLKEIRLPVLRTADVMAYLDLNEAHASKMLARLADSGHIIRIKRGLWVFPEELEPMTLAEYLTVPFPSYVSLQSALYYHGMISQVKALLDFLYLGPAKSKLFSSLPELELPQKFSIKTAEQMLQSIEFKERRTLVEKTFKHLTA